MVKWLSVVMVCVALMAGCSSSESKFYGTWIESGPTGKVSRTIELYKDHAGKYYFTNLDKVQKGFIFKWEMSGDDAIKVVSPVKPVLLKLQGSELIDPDGFRYTKK
jgi:hypothetical protein